jgi:hypothetical protein
MEPFFEFFRAIFWSASFAPSTKTVFVSPSESNAVMGFETGPNKMSNNEQKRNAKMQSDGKQSQRGRKKGEGR